jgi:ribosomal-protein-alanine N-acetyltransferase
MSYNFSPFPVLETERLILRALNLEDAKPLFGLRSNKHVNEFIDRKIPKNLSETRGFIDKISTLIAHNTTVFWVLEATHNNELIGTISLRYFDFEDNYAEIGYEIHPDYQERGYMSEALKMVKEFGFEKLDLKTIEAFTHKNNTASIALLEKHNFIFHPEREDEGFENNRSWLVSV